MAISKEDMRVLEQAKPYIIGAITLLVWLRQPLWSVSSCTAKAKELWEVVKNG